MPNPKQNLDAHSVHVWSGALDLNAQDLCACESVLSDDERARADQFKFEKDRKHFVLARGILRYLLSHYAGRAPSDFSFVYGQKGKPELSNEGGGLQFNVSHSNGVGAWAFSLNRPVGVDIEWVGRRVDVGGIGRRFFSENEWATLNEMPEKKRRHSFFLCWTRKEAFVKALGDGLSFSLKAFDVSVHGQARLTRVEGDQDPDNWTMQSFEPFENYMCAVAFEGKAKVVPLLFGAA